jgi:hypothetical protein
VPNRNLVSAARKGRDLVPRLKRLCDELLPSATGGAKDEKLFRAHIFVATQ